MIDFIDKNIVINNDMDSMIIPITETSGHSVKYFV